MLIFVSDETKVGEFKSLQQELADRTATISEPSDPAYMKGWTSIHWRLTHADGSRGYIEIEQNDAGELTLRLRNTDTSPPEPDLVLFEPRRLDGSSDYNFLGGEKEVRRAIDRWRDYASKTAEDPNVLLSHTKDIDDFAGTFSQIANTIFSPTLRIVYPPSLHSRASIYDSATNSMLSAPDIDHYADLATQAYGNHATVLHTDGSAYVKWTMRPPRTKLDNNSETIDTVSHLRVLADLQARLRA